MSIIDLTVHPEAEGPIRDDVSLLQVDSGRPGLTSPDPAKRPHHCSFTEEFLQAIEATADAARMDPPAGNVALDPRSVAAQPEAFQALWERFADTQIVNATEGFVARRVESWSLHHSTFTRCQTSRITLLSADFVTWRQALVDTWRDRLTTFEDLSFSIVHPMPEDAARGILAQLIVTQRAASDYRSTVLSVYDTDEEQNRMPHTFALVLPR